MNTNYLELINEILSSSLKESEILEFKDYKFEDGKFNSLDSKNMNTLMKEICSFANADGGKIILGIAEDENHNPTKISDTGVNVENFETWEQSFRNKIATKTVPAIYGIKLHHVVVNNDNCIVIEIPKSILRPHAFDDGEHKFYKRNGNESRPMRYSDLKNGFSELEITQQKIYNFITDRISTILDSEIDESLSECSSLILHIIPEWSLDVSNFIDLKKCYNNRALSVISPDYSNYSYYNADGLMKTYETNHNGFSSYLQIFTDGKLEAGEIRLLNDFRDENPLEIYHWDQLEKLIAEKIYIYCKALSELDLGTSFFITLTLLNVRDKYSTTYYGFNRGKAIKKNLIRLPIIKWNILESFEDRMLPIFNNFANIFSVDSSSLYDNNNNPIEEKFSFISKQ